MRAERRRRRASSTRRSTSDKPLKSAWTSSASTLSAASNRAAISAAVLPSGEAPWSRGRGWAANGSCRSASRVTSSGAAWYVATKANASRVLSPWRMTAAARSFCVRPPKAQSCNATVIDRLPPSSRQPRSGARRRARVRRRLTHVVLWSSNLAMATGLSLSSSVSDATTRASSMGPELLRAALADKSRAFIAMPRTGSTTTGTSFRPSLRQARKRLKPSTISKPPSEASATRSGMGASVLRASDRSPRSGASVVCNWSMGIDKTVVMAHGPRRKALGEAETGTRRSLCGEGRRERTRPRPRRGRAAWRSSNLPRTSTRCGRPPSGERKGARSPPA
mgnify:FL=1